MSETATPVPGTTAVVLGGGGVAGIAWEVGVLSALLEAGIAVDDADLVVGTSAGSVVGAFLRTGTIDESYRQQLAPLPTSYEEPVPIAAADFQQHFVDAVTGATSEQDARARVGSVARQVTGGQSGDERTATFAGTFPAESWPTRQFRVTAIDAEDGAFRVFSADDGVPLARAVAASCSVPFVWSTVRIDGHEYMDGGARSATNADAAAGHERVLVLACGPEQPTPTGPWLQTAVEALRASGSQVEVIVADDDSIRSFGTNSLALSTQGPAVRAGRAQASRELERIRSFWG